MATRSAKRERTPESPIQVWIDAQLPPALARPPPQVVWVRCGNVTNRELHQIVLQSWPRMFTLVAEGEPLVEIRRRSEKLT